MLLCVAFRGVDLLQEDPAREVTPLKKLQDYVQAPRIVSSRQNFKQRYW